jgi:hypothetical protein
VGAVLQSYFTVVVRLEAGKYAYHGPDRQGRLRASNVGVAPSSRGLSDGASDAPAHSGGR